MKEYMFNEEYENMKKELINFTEIYNILKISSKEIQKNMNVDDIISYFCIISNEEKVYITFYKEDGTQLIQVMCNINSKEIFKLFDTDLIEEVNVERPDNDGYTYRGFKFNFNEEPYFIKQILYDEINLKDTDLIKEINDEIEYYKDKVQSKNKNIFDYTKTNNVLNKYKFEEE